MGIFDLSTFVNHGDCHLSLNLQPPQFKFAGQGCFLEILEKARSTQFTMNLNRCTNDFPGQFIQIHSPSISSN